jgi:hypothetical protein
MAGTANPGGILMASAPRLVFVNLPARDVGVTRAHLSKLGMSRQALEQEPPNTDERV